MDVKSSSIEAPRPELGRSARRLLAAATAGPLAWLVQLSVQLALVRSLCESGARWPLTATTLLAALVAVAGLAHCLRVLRREPRGPRRAVAAAGVVLDASALVLILSLELPALWLDPCW